MTNIPKGKDSKRKEQIITASFDLACTEGLSGCTIYKLSRILKIQNTLFYYYFNSIDDLRMVVIQKAIDSNRIDIVIDAIFKKIISFKSLSQSVKDLIRQELFSE